jgi:DNA repair protein RecO (recombination protein O)
VGGLVLRFELTALRLLGHLPAIDSCAECGVAVTLSGRVPFGLLSGGVLCAGCRGGKKQVISVSAGVLQTLGQFAALASDAGPLQAIDPRIHGELRGVMNRYLTHLLGHPPQMHRYLGAMAG